MTSPVNVDVKLGVNKFNVDEEHPHIVVKADADKQALELLVKACPQVCIRSRMMAVCASITPDVWSAAPVAFWGWCRRWNSGNTRAAPLVWSFVTVDVGLIRNAVLTLIVKKQE
ncbi:ferredoxin-like protein [Escherichia fergusonii]|nr:ferredoxin-like protein [Escherichia fergusonii]